MGDTIFGLQSPHNSMGKTAVLIGEIKEDDGRHMSDLAYTTFLHLYLTFSVENFIWQALWFMANFPNKYLDLERLDS